MKTITLEKSTNTHSTKSNVKVVEDHPEKMSTMLLKTNGNMIVEHGHHNTVATEEETKTVVKITQQEFNPVLKAFQNSFD